ncbi:MAG TPA: autotransporter-associated beta strand repeat-containing protein [Kiritimatiellia bacterium]|nr:autotransporter-associated beta strand repeat-containing protein [Kiritimatiellia bacterium]
MISTKSRWAGVVCLLVVLHSSAMFAIAADVMKAGNTDNLNLGSSWLGGTPPGASDVGVWSNIVAANTTALGADASWQGIRLTTGNGSVTINAGNRLTLGAAGIDMSSSARNLTLNCTITISASHEWSLAASRQLTLSGAINAGGYEISASGGSWMLLGAALTNAARLTVSNTEFRVFGSTSSSRATNLVIAGGASFWSGNNQSASGFTVVDTTIVSNGLLRVHTRSTVNMSNIVVQANGVVRVQSDNTNNRDAILRIYGVLTNEQDAAGAYTPVSVHNLSGTSDSESRIELFGHVYVSAHAANANSVIWSNPGVITSTAGDGEIRLEAGPHNFEVTDGGADIDLVIEPRLGGTGSLVKRGAGTMALLSLRASTYSGGTIVSNGTLLVNNGALVGSALGTGPVAVETGATLGGAGLFTGAVTNKAGSKLAPGSLGAGTLATGPLTLQAGAEWHVDLDAPWELANGLPSPNDLVAVSGDITLNGQLVVNEQIGFGPGTYTIATYTGTAVDNGITVAPMSGSFSGVVVIDTINKVVNLQVSGAGPPVIVSPTHSGVTHTSAVLGATVASDGGETLTSRGTVWGLSANPTGNRLAEGGITVDGFTHLRTGLTPGTLIYYRGYATNANGIGYTDNASFYTLSAPPSAHVGAFTVVGATTNGLGLSWTPAAGAGGYLVLVRSGADPTGVPSNGVAYTEGSPLGDGTVGAVIVGGSSNSVTLTGLNPGETYYLRIFAYGYNGVNAETHHYKTDGVVPSASGTTFPAAPTVAASGITFPLVGSYSMTIDWTAGNGAQRLVLMRASSAVYELPSDGTDYSASDVFGAGAQIGSGNFVVYKGTGTSVSVSGLAVDTVYHVAVVEFNGTGAATSYKTDSYPTASQITLGSPVHYTLTGHGEVGSDFPAHPADMTVSGSIPQFDYGTFAQSLNMASYNITSPGPSNRLAMNIGWLTYATNSSGGLLLFNSSTGPTPRVSITATGTIRLAGIQVQSSAGIGTDNAPVGSVTLTAPGGVSVNGTIDARHTINQSSGGTVTVVAVSGPVQINGHLLNHGRGGAVSVTGTTISVSNIITYSVGTLRAEPVLLTATAGGVQAGHITNWANDGFGTVTVHAAGGAITVGNIDSRVTAPTTRNLDLRGGPVTLHASGAVTVGAISSTVSRAMTTRLDYGGPVSIRAGQNARVTGNLHTFVNGTFTSGTVASAAGDILIVSTNGDVNVEGPIDAASGTHFFSGQYWSGDLTLQASNGWIFLHSLDVDRVGEIDLRASASRGIVINGAIAGLDTDILDNDIDRFGAVRGHVYYDPVSNAYLGAQTYPIVNSVGGSFNLMPIPFAAAPTVAASALTFSGIGLNQMTLQWVNGNGEGRIVVVRADAAPELPVTGNVYSPNAVFGAGSAIGGSSYVVYRGTGTSVTVTGLQPDTAYYAAVFEYNGLSSYTSYKTDTYPSGHRPTLSESRIALSGASYTVSFADLGEKLPPGARVYTGATATALGEQLAFDPAPKAWDETTGAFKNYASTNGLTSGSSSAAQEASADRALGIRQTIPFGDPGAAFVFALTNTLGYQNIQVDINLLTLAANPRATTWRLEYRVGESGAFTLLNTYVDPGAWGGTNLTGTLGAEANNQSQPVFIRVVTLSASSGSGPARNPLGIARLTLAYDVATATVPTVVDPLVVGVSESSATLGANVTSDGASPILERGTVWGTAPNPTGNAQDDGDPDVGGYAFQRSGLPPGTLIYFRGYASNAQGVAYSPQDSFVTLSTEPSSHAGAFTGTASSVSSINLSWTPAAGASGYVITMRKNSAPITQPSDTETYTVGQTLGDGIVAAVINSGSTTNAVISGLEESTLYRFAIYPFSYNGVHAASRNYRTAPTIPLTSATTLSPLYVVRWTFPNQGNFSANALADLPPGSLAMNQTKTITTAGGTDAMRFDRSGAATYSAAAAGWNAGASSKWWQVEFDTTGYGGLLLSSKQRSAASAPRDFALQVSPDGQTWFPVSNVPNVADNWTGGVLSDLALPNALANRGNIAVRWIMRNNTAVNGGSVSGAAETIIDDILVKGESVSPGGADLVVSVVATPSSTFVNTDVSLAVTVSNKGSAAVSGALLGAAFSTNATATSASNSGLIDGLRAGWSLPAIAASGAVQRVLVLRSASINDIVTELRVFAAETPVDAATWIVTNTVVVNCNPGSQPFVEPLPNQTVVEGQNLTFTVRAYRSGCTPNGLELTHSQLPGGASMGTQTTNGLFVERVFSWTPGIGATNTYPIQFSASDAAATNHFVVLVYVAGIGESLSNGVPASQVGWSPTIVDVERPSGSAARVLWLASSGLTYTVFYSDSLPGAGTMMWTPYANVYATNSTLSFDVPSVSEARRYFQVMPVGQSPSERNLWSVQRRSIVPGLQMWSIPLPMSDRSLTGEVGQILSGVLNATGLYNSADKLHIIEPNQSFRTFWLRLVSGDKIWYENASPVTDFAIGPAQGMFIERLAGTAVTPEFFGAIGNVDAKSVELVEGYNLISLSEGRGLQMLSAFNKLASGSPSSYANSDMLLADQIIMEDTPGVWVLFWRTSTGWVRWSASGTSSANTFILEPGRAYYYLRRAGQGTMEIRY